MISFFHQLTEKDEAGQARLTKLKSWESQLFWNYLEFSLFKITSCLIKCCLSQIWNVSSLLSLHYYRPLTRQSSVLRWYGVAAAPDSQLYSSLGTELWAGWGWGGRERGCVNILKLYKLYCSGVEVAHSLSCNIHIGLGGCDRVETNINIILVQLKYFPSCFFQSPNILTLHSVRPGGMILYVY